jgi:transposase-like protein
MPELAPEQWEEIRRLYLENQESLTTLAARFGVNRTTISQRAAREGWPSRKVLGDASLLTATVKVRRKLIRRLYKAIDTKLKLMERRMQLQMNRLDKGKDMPSADHERDTRGISALIKSFDQVTEIATDFDRTADGRSKSAAAALASEADAFRREIAARLEKLVPAR